ncbi:hypothetical protein [Streptomyces sp. NPDC093089]|uniref:hypothetical protein n=1 Tax=Streptomyces sp. NPDC093089 TaxID=3366024 RepID=UPI00382B1F47
MDFTLLGAFEARHEGRCVRLGSRRQERCLLAVLLLEAGRPVATDRLGGRLVELRLTALEQRAEAQLPWASTTGSSPTSPRSPANTPAAKGWWPPT